MSTRTLVSSVTCPHCWTEFPPAQVRFVAEHASLQGDSVLGSGDMMRFLPSRFDARGRAIDPAGATATRTACTRCHLELPPAVLELPQTIVSIVGGPSCGKSVMLAAATFSLRSGMVIPGMDFIDADPALNDLTFDLESSLFRSISPDTPTMIAKTDVAGRIYRSFRIGEASWVAPKPQLFVVGRGERRTLLCMYDNSGEHFLPGTDAAHQPVTRHLAASRALVFVLDPTQDRRVIERLGGLATVQSRGGATSLDQRQDLILIEVANRVRRLRGLSPQEPLPFRIVLALAKADIWGDLATPPISAEYDGFRAASSIAIPTADVLHRVHGTCRDFLRGFMPELLAAAETLDPTLHIVPFSGLGTAPSANGDAALLIRPRDVRPVWPAAPLVVALASADPALFPEYGEA